MRIARLFVCLLVCGLAASTASAQVSLDPLLTAVLNAGGDANVRVIVRARDAGSLSLLLPVIRLLGGTIGRPLGIINGVAATVPAAAVPTLSGNLLVAGISLDREARGSLERTGATIGSTAVRQQFGYDGTGVGVAVIDSGVTAWHDDLEGAGAQRVDRFVDFVNGRTFAYDDYGHGTHVSGIIAGDGFDSSGRRAGIAPGARLTVLKVLDANGAGRISDVIAALDYVDVNHTALHVRVVNLSVGAGVYESYTTDPLTLAARQLVAHGIVVVAAAGNAGKDPAGHVRYGGITAPGNAPWVLTVGASSHMGTIDRADDTIAAFSSRGPAAIDYEAKPDLVAPGVGIESLSDPSSTFYRTRSAYLLPGTIPTAYLPYLSLNGTSMSAPVVTGTVALMLQANPALTPNLVKAILEYTAELHPDDDALTQGAGFLNAAGAVELARYFANTATVYPDDSNWSRRITWANHRMTGQLAAGANAWGLGVTWDNARTAWGALVQWGQGWRASCANLLCTSITWGSPSSPNVVWGVRCGGSDCRDTWRPSIGATTALSRDDSDTVVWGNNDNDTVVWGNNDEDTVVWGNSDDGDTVVWGNGCVDSSCEPVVWPPSAN
jgi:serine protease AprX